MPLKSNPKKIVICTHAKRSCVELCEALLSIGTELAFYPVDYSKDQTILSKLKSIGVEVIDRPENLVAAIESADCAIEDGARVSKIIADSSIKVREGFYTVEQTSGGVRYFSEIKPKYPVINVAMSPMKLHIENKLATPESILQCFLSATGSMLSGKRVLVLGYGSIGEGIARLANSIGARITVFDTLATKRLFAKHQGFETVEADEFNAILSKQDVIFMATNTYQGSLIGVQQLLLLKDGVWICNTGSGRGEVSAALQSVGELEIHDSVVNVNKADGNLIIKSTKYGVTKTATILAEAFPINLHFGDGTSHDAIQIVMSLMLAASLNGPISDETGLQDLDYGIQETVASIALNEDHDHQKLHPIHIKQSQLQKTIKPYGELYPFNTTENSNTNVALARVVYNRDTKTRGHYHAKTQEYYYALKGNAELILQSSDELSPPASIHIEQGDYLVVPENYYHDVKVPPETEFECLVITAPAFDIWDQFFKPKGI